MDLVLDLLKTLDLDFTEAEKAAHAYAAKYHNWDIDDFEAYMALYDEKYKELIS